MPPHNLLLKITKRQMRDESKLRTKGKEQHK